MKKLIICTLAALLAIPVLAQNRGYYNRPNPNNMRTYRAPRPYSNGNTNTYYGLRIGLDVSTVSSESSSLDGGSSSTGLGLGGYVGFQLAPATPLYLEVGFEYKEKGGESTYQGSKFTYGLNYLEMPIVLKYQIDVDNDATIQPFLGGYLACGVSGKIKNYGAREASSSYRDDYFQRFDGGLRFGCGIQYNVLYAEIGYDLGLANIGHSDFDTTHTRCFFANVGVNF